MPYDSRAYRILIASPSDVEEEREIAVRVIQEWNDLHSYSRNVVLLPLRWETHTAPEYGSRPQDVINRAIVDQCDLLIGVFWTRIGTPTGEADSGTLEEIERVARAGKPVMLYFSKVGIDPNVIDLDQVASLKAFKEKTYPVALVETYKSHIDFRDKFSRQLEMKVRDIQAHDVSDQPPPLALGFYSVEKQSFVEKSTTCNADKLEFSDLEDHLSSAESEKIEERIRDVANDIAQATLSVPLVLAIKNKSTAGVRNLYVEMSVRSTSTKTQVSESPTSRTGSYRGIDLPNWASILQRSRLPESDLEQTIAQFKTEGLTHKDGGWNFSFAWDALQPERIRIVEPVLYVRSPEDVKLALEAKVYADNFPTPLQLNATMKVKVKTRTVRLEEVVADLTSLKKEPKDELLTSRIIRSITEKIG